MTENTESTATETVETVEADAPVAISAARQERKRAQALLSDLKHLVFELESHITGRSGLSATEKTQTLATAKDVATQVTEAAQEVKTAIESAHQASTAS